MIMADQTHAITLVDQLEALLDDQIISAENGQFEQVEALMEEASVLAGEIVETRAFDAPQCRILHRGIARRYGRLEMILACAKANTKDELKLAKTTMKMLAAYRSSSR